LAEKPDPLQNQPITIALILASDNEEDQKEDNDIPELLETQIRAAQLRDKTCQRVVKKL
jgi:hypothetical protein